MADPYGDQAAGLRRLFATPQLRIISFAAGCAGVGKSLSVINLATILAGQGRVRECEPGVYAVVRR